MRVMALTPMLTGNGGLTRAGSATVRGTVQTMLPLALIGFVNEFDIVDMTVSQAASAQGLLTILLVILMNVFPAGRRILSAEVE